jgi:hypothetical protein
MGKACGNPECGVSTGIHDGLTFGSGNLDMNGFWEHPCALCARLNEKLYPEDGECWPFKPPEKLTREDMLEAVGHMVTMATEDMAKLLVLLNSLSGTLRDLGDSPSARVVESNVADLVALSKYVLEKNLVIPKE